MGTLKFLANAECILMENQKCTRIINIVFKVKLMNKPGGLTLEPAGVCEVALADFFLSSFISKLQKHYFPTQFSFILNLFPISVDLHHLINIIKLFKKKSETENKNISNTVG
jgi:hypothetical protein